MSPSQASPEQIIQAAAMTPSFTGAYRSAPASIRVNGKTYERDAARNASERVWYLAACAMVNPKAVYEVGRQGATEMALAFDETEVELDSKVVAARERVAAAQKKVSDAEKDVDDARRARDDAKTKTSAIQQKIDAGEAEIKSLQAQIADLGRVKDAGDFFAAALSMGASKLIPKADLEIRLEQMRKHTAQERQNLAALPSLPAAETALKGAQRRLAAAKKELTTAETAVTVAEDAVRKRLRDAEEKQRQEEARKKSEEAAERAREEAAERQRQADEAYNAWLASGGDGGYGGGDPWGDYYGSAGDEYIEPEWHSDDWATTDEDAELGDVEWLDESLEEQADLYGDEDYAIQMAELTGEPIIGVNTRVSPYSIDGYYEGYDLERDEVFGNDTAALVGGIVAGVLAMAPAIINAVSPPPSKDRSAADTNAGAAKLSDPDEPGYKPPPAPASSSSSTFNIDTFLEKIGLKKTINDAAAAAGGSAGKQGGQEVTGTVTGYLAVAAVVGLAFYVASR